MAKLFADKPTGNQEPKIEFDYSQADAVFSDVVQVKIAEDMVVFGFAQRDVVDRGKAKVTHKVYMSISHFLRFTQINKATADRIIEELQKPEPEKQR